MVNIKNLAQINIIGKTIYPPAKDDQIKLEKKNQTITLNVLLAKDEEEEIYYAYLSKHNTKSEKSCSFNDLNKRWLALSYLNKAIFIINRSNINL